MLSGTNMKLQYIGIVCILLGLHTCSPSSNTPLASFEGGNVTIQEFRNFYKASGLSGRGNKPALKDQISILEAIALREIAYIDADKKGLTRNKEFTDVLSVAEKQIISNVYRQMIITQQQSINAFYQIGNIAERTRLRTISKNG